MLQLMSIKMLITFDDSIQRTAAVSTKSGNGTGRNVADRKKNLSLDLLIKYLNCMLLMRLIFTIFGISFRQHFGDTVINSIRRSRKIGRTVVLLSILSTSTTATLLKLRKMFADKEHTVMLDLSPRLTYSIHIHKKILTSKKMGNLTGGSF